MQKVIVFPKESQDDKMKYPLPNMGLQLSAGQIMNTNYRILRLNDSIEAAIRLYQEFDLNTLPVVDSKNELIGVLTAKEVSRALLAGAGQEDLCARYVTYNPPTVSTETSMEKVLENVNRPFSKGMSLIVVGPARKIMGLIGIREILHGQSLVKSWFDQLFDAFLNTERIAVFMVNQSGTILFANQSAEKLIGRHVSTIKGTPVKEFFPALMLKDKKTFETEQTFKSRSVMINQMPLLYDKEWIGSLLTVVEAGMAAIVEPADDLEAIREMQSTLESILASSTEAIFILDKRGRIKYVNDNVNSLLLFPKNIVGKPLDSVLSDNSVSQAIKNGVQEIGDITVHNKKRIFSCEPIKKKEQDRVCLKGMIFRIYLDDNVLVEQVALKLLSLKQQVNYYRGELDKISSQYSFENIFTNNPEMITIKRDARQIARSPSTILLTGESGVGKDLFARAIHSASPRQNKPFVEVNCTAIPETLFESELFGYAPGAFTGALKKGKPGFFEQAEGGTIFLDEIGEMPLSAQVKLLHVLQGKNFVRVGGTKQQIADVRIIAATNKNLRQAVDDGEFREDLFYRLSVIEFHIPTLYQRQEDIVPLAELFIGKYNLILGANITGINKAAKRALQNYQWPGNIRELENAIERAANYVWEGEIGVEHLPAQIFQAAPAKSDSTEYRDIMSDVDKEIIIDVLNKAKGNKSEAARMLNISRTAFYNKIKKYDLL